MKNKKLKIAILMDEGYKSQQDFALQVGMTPDRLSKIINHGLTCVSNAPDICKALDKTKDELGL